MFLVMRVKQSEQTDRVRERERRKNAHGGKLSRLVRVVDFIAQLIFSLFVYVYPY